MSGAEAYTCSLCEASIEKARRELREDPRERLGAVQTLRDWIDQQKWLTAPMDALYLLAILRTKKFSQLESRALLERIWTVRTKYPDWYRGLKPCTPQHLDFLRKSPLYTILPKKDKDGRTIVLGRFSAIDVSGDEYNGDELVLNVLPVFDALLLDEEAQVNGYVFLMDCSGMSLKMLSFFGPDRMRRNGEVTQKAMAARMKQINYVNVGPAFEAIFSLIRPFLGDKILSRVVMHGKSMVSVYKNIDMSLLPDEYLPDDYTGPRVGSCQQIMDEFIQDKLMEPKVQAFLDTIYNGPYGVDLSLKPSDDPPQASFRKLNVS